MTKKFDDSYSECRKVVNVSIFVNVLLMAYKLIIGFLGNSSAVIADGVHSLSDLLTDMVVMIGVKYANKPEDEDHPYGHGKVENFASFVISVTLIIVGVGIIYGAYRNIASGVELKTPKMITLTAVLLSIILKEFLFRYTYSVGKKHNLNSLIANAWHHRSDAYSSIAAMVGVVGAMMGIKALDPIAAAVVAVLIGKVGYDIGKGAFMDLIDTAADRRVYERIVRIVEAMDEVKSYHGLKTRTMGNRVISELQIRVDPAISVVKGHDIATALKANILESIKEVENILIHVEPVGGAGRVEYMFEDIDIDEACVKKSLRSIPGVKGLHCLNVHHLGGDKILTVDIEVDPSLSVERGHSIAKEAKANVLSLCNNLKDVVVHIDPYEG